MSCHVVCHVFDASVDELDGRDKVVWGVGTHNRL